MICATACALMVVGQVVLPGSLMEPQRAHAEAHTVVVAEVVRFKTLIGLGAVWYASGLELKPTAVLKGDAGEAVLKGLSMQGGSERFTKPGEVHIFFIGEYNGHPKILKVLPKTDENLASIRAMGD